MGDFAMYNISKDLIIQPQLIESRQIDINKYTKVTNEFIKISDMDINFEKNLLFLGIIEERFIKLAYLNGTNRVNKTMKGRANTVVNPSNSEGISEKNGNSVNEHKDSEPCENDTHLENCEEQNYETICSCKVLVYDIAVILASKGPVTKNRIGKMRKVFIKNQIKDHLSITYFKAKNWLIVGSSNNFLKIWSLKEIGLNHNLQASVTKEFGNKLCCEDVLHERILKIFDVRFKKQQNNIRYTKHFGVNSIQVLEDSHLLLIGCKSPFSIMAFNVKDVETCLSDAVLLFYFLNGGVNHIAIFQKNKMLLSFMKKGSLRIHNLNKMDVDGNLPKSFIEQMTLNAGYGTSKCSTSVTYGSFLIRGFIDGYLEFMPCDFLSIHSLQQQVKNNNTEHKSGLNQSFETDNLETKAPISKTNKFRRGRSKSLTNFNVDTSSIQVHKELRKLVRKPFGFIIKNGLEIKKICIINPSEILIIITKKNNILAYDLKAIRNDPRFNHEEIFSINNYNFEMTDCKTFNHFLVISGYEKLCQRTNAGYLLVIDFKHFSKVSANMDHINVVYYGRYHNDIIHCLSFCQFNQWIITGSKDGIIKIMS